MKVTINPAGEVTLEITNTADALEVIRALRNGALPPFDVVEPQPAKPRRKRNQSKASNSAELPAAQAEVHEYLAGHEPDGISVTTLADMFGTKAAAMGQRLRSLEKRGLVEKVGRGIYRVVQ